MDDAAAGTSAFDALPAYLYAVRTLKGARLTRFEAVTRLHNSYLSRLERQIYRPSPANLDRLADPDAYGCPWWSSGANRLFLRALAYHATHRMRYGPAYTEWRSADMNLAIAAARVIAAGSAWAQSGRWLAVVARWAEMGLQGRDPNQANTAGMSQSTPPGLALLMVMYPPSVCSTL